MTVHENRRPFLRLLAVVLFCLALCTCAANGEEAGVPEDSAEWHYPEGFSWEGSIYSN